MARVCGVTIEELLGVATGQAPPWESWAVFLDTREAETMTGSERMALQSFAWPSEPSVSQYLMLLAVVRMAPAA